MARKCASFSRFAYRVSVLCLYFCAKEDFDFLRRRQDSSTEEKIGSRCTNTSNKSETLLLMKYSNKIIVPRAMILLIVIVRAIECLKVYFFKNAFQRWNYALFKHLELYHKSFEGMN